MKQPFLKSKVLVPVAAAVALLGAPVAHAGGIEDAFRGFIARLQAAGQRVMEAPVLRTSREIVRPEAAMRTDSLPLGEREVAVFVEAGCRTCQFAVNDLRALGWRIEVFDLSTSALARQSYALTGAKGVPAVLVGRRILSGYSRQLFQEQQIDDLQKKGDEQRGTGA